MFQIENLPELVKDYLGSDREFVDYTATNLTAPGDNYGSLILSVEIKAKNRATNAQEIIKVVAKTPPTNEFAQKIFNTQVTFKNEIEFYKNIWPALQNLQKEHGLKPSNYVADFAGARLNLNNSDEVDKDAVLLLENLVVKKFEVLSRELGFDLEATKLILKDLANFHATAIAYKSQKPEDFKTKILPYVDGMFFDKVGDDMLVTNLNKSIDILEKTEKTKDLAEKARKLAADHSVRTYDSPFSTLVHADLWVNNLMLKLNDKKIPTENKFVDFQVCRLQSPADDLLFFLLTSVQDDVIANKLENLIEFYYKEFVFSLEKLNCDTKPFTYENFTKEIHSAKTEQFRHIICMLFPIFLEKSKAKEMKDFKPDTEGEPPNFELNPRQEEKIILVAQCYEKLGLFD